MPETGTSGLMSGERKRSAGSRSEPQATAPLLDSTFPHLDGWALCCLQSHQVRAAYHLPAIAREYVAAQATVLKLGIREAPEVFVGSCRGPIIGPVLYPCAEF